jgi:hypothetical protein
MSCKRGRKIDRSAMRLMRRCSMHRGQVRRRNERAKARALVRRILRNAATKTAGSSLRSVALTLHIEWREPFGDETQPRRDRERSKRVVAIAHSLTAHWRSRRSVCGQCGERDPEQPCGNPCNQCPF